MRHTAASLSATPENGADPTSLWPRFKRRRHGHGDSRDSWGEFQTRHAETQADIYVYGQIKATIAPVLMILAEPWAADIGWRP